MTSEKRKGSTLLPGTRGKVINRTVSPATGKQQNQPTVLLRTGGEMIHQTPVTRGQKNRTSTSPGSLKNVIHRTITPVTKKLTVTPKPDRQSIRQTLRLLTGEQTKRSTITTHSHRTITSITGELSVRQTIRSVTDLQRKRTTFPPRTSSQNEETQSVVPAKDKQRRPKRLSSSEYSIACLAVFEL